MLSPAIIRLIPQVTPFIQQARSTWILKRRLPTPLRPRWESPFIVGEYIKDLNPHPGNPEDHDLYDHNDYKQTDELDVARPKVKVILLKHVDTIGAAGDVVEVDADIARYQLLLPKNAVYASEFNLNWYKELITGADKQAGPSSLLSPVTIKRLALEVFAVTMSDVNPWIVEKWHIRNALRTAGLLCPEDVIELPSTSISGPDSNKQNKAFIVYVTINGRERVPVKCVIHHRGIDLKEQWWAGLLEPIIEEQRQRLESLPYQERTVRDEEVIYDDDFK